MHPSSMVAPVHWNGLTTNNGGISLGFSTTSVNRRLTLGKEARGLLRGCNQVLSRAQGVYKRYLGSLGLTTTHTESQGNLRVTSEGPTGSTLLPHNTGLGGPPPPLTHGTAACDVTVHGSYKNGRFTFTAVAGRYRPAAAALEGTVRESCPKSKLSVCLSVNIYRGSCPVAVQPSLRPQHCHLFRDRKNFWQVRKNTSEKRMSRQGQALGHDPLPHRTARRMRTFASRRNRKIDLCVSLSQRSSSEDVGRVFRNAEQLPALARQLCPLNMRGARACPGGLEVRRRHAARTSYHPRAPGLSSRRSPDRQRHRPLPLREP